MILNRLVTQLYGLARMRQIPVAVQLGTPSALPSFMMEASKYCLPTAKVATSLSDEMEEE